MFDEPIYFVRPRFVGDFAKTFTAVAEAGIKHIVLGRTMGTVDFMDEKQFLEGKSVLEQLNLKPSASHGLIPEPFELNEPDETYRKSMIDSHVLFMHRMAELGCKTYTCHPGKVLPGYSREQLWDYVKYTLDSLVPDAEKLGLTIAIENANPNNLGDNAVELLNFVREYDCANVGICYDCGHAHRSEDTMSVLETVFPLLVTAHLHDNDKTVDQHLIPGHGTIDWPPLVNKLKQCPSLIHIETEAFNTEKWPHEDVYATYCKRLSN